MKKLTNAMMLLASLILTTACSSDDPLSDLYDNSAINGNNMGSNGSQAAANASSSELLSFTVNIDKTTAEPATTTAASYPEASDDISKNTFETIVNIDMSNPQAKEENGVTITVNGNDVTASHGSTSGVQYVVTGSTSDGSLTIDGKADFLLNLNDATITSTRGVALDIESKNKAFVVLSGTNKLTDGTSADDGHKGAVFAKGKMIFSGTGSLSVYGTYNNGIHGKSNIVFDKGVNMYVSSTANHGIKAGDDLYINGGILNVEI